MLELDDDFMPVIQLVAPGPLDRATLREPPDWAIRCVCPGQGRRGRKYPLVWESSKNEFGNANGFYRDGVWQSYSSFPPHLGGPLSESWEAAQKRRREARAARRKGEKQAARFRVPAGNLSEDEYRFWIGSEYKTHLTATCRWCAQTFYNKSDREIHGKVDTKHMSALLVVYRRARNHGAHLCLVCGEVTKSERYGLPLCPTESCLHAWKFRRDPDMMPFKGLNSYAKLCMTEGLLKGFVEDDMDRPGL